MFSCKRSGIFFLILLCFVLSLSGTTIASGLSPFNDVPDSHWASLHILKMELREVINGYGDGTFKPDNTVNQLEAVTMAVRAMGLQSETERTDLNIDVSQYFLPTSWNAEGFVKVALEKGIIDTDNFYPYSSASRAWVAQLVIRMIDAEDEVQETASTNFDDDASIPASARSYVALAAEKQIINGIENLSGGFNFLPNIAVKRAELATMISRSDRYMNNVQGQLPIAEVTSTGFNTLSLQQFGEDEKSYPLASGIVIFDTGAKRSAVSILQAGDLIRFKVNQQGDIVFIEQLNKEHYQSQAALTGTVVQHFRDERLLTVQSSDGKLHTYTYSSHIRTDTLQVGDQVTVTVNNDVITEIRLQNQKGDLVRGKVFSVNMEKNILTLEADTRYASYIIADNVTVDYAGVRFPTVRDLVQGDEIEITLEENQVTSISLIKAASKESLSGRIVGISTTEQILTVRTTGDRLIAIEVAENAVITISGIANPLFADLKVDDYIDFSIEDHIAHSLAVTNRGYQKEVTGRVEALNSSTRVIVLENAQGELDSYRIDDEVYLDLNKSYPKLSDITVGMTVTLKLESNIVFEINLQNKIKGEIEQIDSQRALVTLKTDEGRKSYNINDALIRIIGVTNARVSDLEVGQQAVLTLVEGSVAKVEIVVQNVTTVTSVETSVSRLGVRYGSTTVRYYVYPDTNFTIQGINNPSLRDVKVGDTVSLTFLGRELQQVEVIPARYGFIASVNQLTGKIVVRTTSGQETITINDALTIYSDTNNKMSAGSLKVHDYVKVITTDEGTMIYESKVLTGEVVAVDFSTRTLYILDDDHSYQWFTLTDDVHVWEGSSGNPVDNLEIDTNVKLYIFDNQVFGISVIDALG